MHRVLGVVVRAMLIAALVPAVFVSSAQGGTSCSLLISTETAPTPDIGASAIAGESVYLDGIFAAAAEVTITFLRNGVVRDEALFTADSDGSLHVDLLFEPEDIGPWEITATTGDGLCTTSVTASVGPAGPSTIFSVTTRICPQAIQSAAALQAAGADACPVAVVPMDEPDLPTGYSTDLRTVSFDYLLATSDTVVRGLEDAFLDGGGSCDPGRKTCTFMYGYAWIPAATGMTELSGFLPGYRLGHATVTSITHPVATVPATTDLANDTIAFDLPEGDGYQATFYWFVAAPSFSDIAASPFRFDIEWLAATAITNGCGGGRYCPMKVVTRDQMASFIARALELPDASEDYFSDDDGSGHEEDINRIAAAGITIGCADGRYCPTMPVRRDQMASFLSRALDVAASPTNWFSDDNGSNYEADINRIAAAGITLGCGGGKYCPKSSVTREQMAAFLHRALD